MGKNSATGSCLKCGRCLKLRSRGLCKTCYNHMTPAQRKAYPALYDPHGCGVNRERGNVTEEELDALIAAQMADLPAWWRGEAGASEKEIRRFVRWRLPVINLRGGRVMKKGFVS